jgi:hypothetical protein
MHAPARARRRRKRPPGRFAAACNRTRLSLGWRSGAGPDEFGASRPDHSGSRSRVREDGRVMSPSATPPRCHSCPIGAVRSCVRPNRVPGTGNRLARGASGHVTRTIASKPNTPAQSRRAIVWPGRGPEIQQRRRDDAEGSAAPAQRGGRGGPLGGRQAHRAGERESDQPVSAGQRAVVRRLQSRMATQ